MKKSVLVVLMLCSMVVLISSCGGSNAVVQRETISDFKVITENIYTSIPGALMYGNGMLVWEDPRATDGFVHVVDATTGEELLQWGTLGQGPEEFTSANVSFGCPPILQVMDLNNGKLATAKLSRDGTLNTSWSKLDMDNAMQMIQVDESHLLFSSPDWETPFKIRDAKASVTACGKFPVSEHIDNAFDMLQASIAYLPKQGLLLYSSMRFPYMAMYQYKNGAISLLWEKGEMESLNINDSKLVVEKGTEKGPQAVTLTKNYIVAAKKDMKHEEAAPKQAGGRDMSQLPQSLFLYGMSGELQRIINLDIPIVRIAGNPETDKVYAIIANPEFQVVEIGL